MHGVPIPISRYMLLSSSPPIHLLIEEGRIKSALESQGSLSQRRECLNQDTKGMWALPVTHREGAERKEHAKACLRSYKEFDALRASNTARKDLWKYDVGIRKGDLDTEGLCYVVLDEDPLKVSRELISRAALETLWYMVRVGRSWIWSQGDQ